MAELSYKAKWQLEEIEKATAELRKEVLRLETALDESTGIVQPLKVYPLDAVVNKTNLRGHGTPEAARRSAEQAYAASLPVVEENAAIVATNQRVLARIVQVITNAGLPEKVSVQRPRSRYKWDSVETEWAAAIRQHIPTYDKWPDLQRSYKVWLENCDRWRKEIDAEAQQQERARAAEKRKIDCEIVRREMVAKYELAENADLSWDVRQHIIGQHKYLYLAHFLEANRGDWNEGCDYARTGLDGFKVETDRDREVANEISALCSDWDCDGRVFRDCKWNYSVLYAIVAEEAPELLADYRKVSALIVE